MSYSLCKKIVQGFRPSPTGLEHCAVSRKTFHLLFVEQNFGYPFQNNIAYLNMIEVVANPLHVELTYH